MRKDRQGSRPRRRRLGWLEQPRPSSAHPGDFCTFPSWCPRRGWIKAVGRDVLRGGFHNPPDSETRREDKKSLESLCKAETDLLLPVTCAVARNVFFGVHLISLIEMETWRGGGFLGGRSSFLPQERPRWALGPSREGLRPSWTWCLGTVALLCLLDKL